MPASNKPLVTASGGATAPQYFDVAADAYDYVEGRDGAVNQNLQGSSVLLGASQLVTAITAVGTLVLAARERRELTIINRGTATLWVYPTADGTGNPVEILPGGTQNDDGFGGRWQPQTWDGPVWLKAPAGGGRAGVADW